MNLNDLFPKSQPLNKPLKRKQRITKLRPAPIKKRAALGTDKNLIEIRRLNDKTARLVVYLVKLPDNGVVLPGSIITVLALLKRKNGVCSMADIVRETQAPVDADSFVFKRLPIIKHYVKVVAFSTKASANAAIKVGNPWYDLLAMSMRDSAECPLCGSHANKPSGESAPSAASLGLNEIEGQGQGSKDGH